MRGCRTPRSDIAPEYLREVVDYNQHTGEFYRGSGRGFGKKLGTRQSNGYVKVCVDGDAYLAHRLAWLYVHGHWPRGVIDHINGDKSDNRILNLRDVSQEENVRAYLTRRSAMEASSQ